MNEFVNTLKNSEIYSLIKKDIDNNNLAQAYMIISPDTEAIKQLFTLIACAIYCNNNACLECKNCTKVLHYNHCDIKYINELSQNIKVNDIKEIIEDVYIRPYESDKKLYFIHSADKMNTAAQNKLLKTLEEPPENVIIFLGVSRETAMLETIKSRVRKLYLDRFSNETIYNYIYELTGNEKKAQMASICSDGKLGFANEISQNEKYDDVYDEVLAILGKMKKSSDIASVLNNKVLIGDKLPIFLDTLSLIIRDMLVSKTNLDLMLSKHRTKIIIELSNEYSSLALGRIIYLINEERKKINFHVSNASIVENLMFGILEEKYKCRKL